MKRRCWGIAAALVLVTSWAAAQDNPQRNLAVELFKNIDWDPDDKLKELFQKDQGQTRDALPAQNAQGQTQSPGLPGAFDFNALLNREAVEEYYMDSINGNDANSGRSLQEAWGSLEKVNAARLKPGTTVYLKKGSVFRGRIKAQNGVTYGAYGSGEKPALLGSIRADAASSWIRERKNLWVFRSPHPGFAVDIGNIIFDDGRETGIRVFDGKQLNADKKFWFDKKNRLVRLYSVQDPRVRWRQIEFASPLGGIEMKDTQGVVVRDLAVRYVSGHAISIENCRDIIVDGLDIAYVGGANLFGVIGIPGVKRYGNAIEVYKSGRNILIQNNTIDQVYDAALTNQSYEAEARQENIIYRGNTVSNAEYCLEMWIYARNSLMKDVLAEDNVCRGSGQGWGHGQRPDGANGRNIMVFKNAARTENVVIRGNTFYRAAESHARFADPADEKSFIIRDNQFPD